MAEDVHTRTELHHLDWIVRMGATSNGRLSSSARSWINGFAGNHAASRAAAGSSRRFLGELGLVAVVPSSIGVLLSMLSSHAAYVTA
jgi:hypothetical protein